MAKCPVCGMNVDEQSAQHTLEHNGQTYYFCAPGCRRLFERDPARFISETPPRS